MVDERRVARDLLRMLSLAATPMRVIHRCPSDLFAGLQGLLDLSAKRHRRYWAAVERAEQEQVRESTEGEERDLSPRSTTHLTNHDETKSTTRRRT